MAPGEAEIVMRTHCVRILATLALLGCAQPDKYVAVPDSAIGGGEPDASKGSEDSSSLDGRGPAGTGGSAPDASAEAGCGSPDDPRNCGTCGHDCTGLANVRVGASVQCQAGKCVIPAAACVDGYGHCTASADDGCETSLTRAQSCGTCTTACSGTSSLCSSVGGKYQCASSCAAPTPDNCGSSCANLQTDIQNCGRCGAGCTVPNAQPKCEGGTCKVASCRAGYGDCNNQPGDGCETDVMGSDHDNCGSCGRKCTAAQTCVNGTCVGECTPNTKQCGPSNTPQTCSPSGMWVSGSKCKYVCTGQGECGGDCVPGMSRCNLTSHETCDESGRWAPSSGDCTSPTVVSVSPQDGSTGVRSDAVIQITFSEPMDRASTQSAFAANGFSSPIFAWSSGDRVLGVSAPSGFTYATGDIGVIAKQYGFSMGTTATDTSGNRLASAASGSFRTLRRVTMSFTPIYPMTAPVGMDGFVYSNSNLWVGCSTSVSGSRGFITFDISGLPAGIVDLESAALDMIQDASMGTPANNPIEVGQVRFQVLGSSSTFSTSVLKDIGPITTSFGAGSRHLANTQLRDAVRDDYRDRQSQSNRSQYRLSDTGVCGTGDHYFLMMGGTDPRLSATFLVN